MRLAWGRGLLTFAVVLWPIWTQAWDESLTKPVAALERMEQKELALEAQNACFDVCLTRMLQPPRPTDAAKRSQHQQAALHYLQTVGLVARQKNGGDFPAWYKEMRDIAQAATPHKPNKCTAIYFQFFYGGGK